MLLGIFQDLDLSRMKDGVQLGGDVAVNGVLRDLSILVDEGTELGGIAGIMRAHAMHFVNSMFGGKSECLAIK